MWKADVHPGKATLKGSRTNTLLAFPSVDLTQHPWSLLVGNAGLRNNCWVFLGEAMPFKRHLNDPPPSPCYVSLFNFSLCLRDKNAGTNRARRGPSIDNSTSTLQRCTSLYRELCKPQRWYWIRQAKDGNPSALDHGLHPSWLCGMSNVATHFINLPSHRSVLWKPSHTPVRWGGRSCLLFPGYCYLNSSIILLTHTRVGASSCKDVV